MPVPLAEVADRYAGPLLVLPLGGEVAIAGEIVNPGGCALAPAIDAIEFGAASRALVTQSV